MENCKNLERKSKLIGSLTATFVELGYRKATTAQLAKRAGVQEMVLYRLWPGKKQMFIDAIDYVHENSISIWENQINEMSDKSKAAELLLEYESLHMGEFDNYKIIFAALGEADDPDIRQALSRMYFHFHSFIVEQIAGVGGSAASAKPQLQAWALIALGTMSTITKDLGLLSESQRKDFMQQIGGSLLGKNDSVS